MLGNTELDHSHRNSTDIRPRHSNNSPAVVDQLIIAPVVVVAVSHHTTTDRSISTTAAASCPSHSQGTGAMFLAQSQPLAVYQPGP